MSVNLTQSGSLRSIGLIPSVVTTVAAYTAPSQAAPYLVSINLANRSGSAVTTTVEWFSAKTGLSVAVVPESSLAAKTRLIVDDIVIAMRDGDRIDVKSGTANALEVILTIMERSGPSQ